VSHVLRLMQREDLEPIVENQARAEIQEQYMTCDKAHKAFGWQPEYGMDEALLETIDWYSDYFGIPAETGVVRGAAAHASM
jgi:CDP-glucose 4,6-dehydratase